ncbi:MAG: FHA domain-containing protein [Luteimonas sp.]
MPDAQNDNPTPDPCRLLRIVSGLHAGASRALAEREMILVGSGDDCDIVLADDGVAAHHALISVVDGHFQLRALDAPLKLEGRTLHPGDPVEMDRLQRVGLGEAALAFGLEDDPAWLALAPEDGQLPASRTRGFAESLTRRLPMIAAVAVLCLASLAIFVAVVPSAEPRIDPEARLKQLAREYSVSDRSIERDVNREPVLSGMVKDAATRKRFQEQVAEEGLPVSLVLTTGEDLADNVAEMLRAGGFPARTRYLGSGRIEATGYFEDPEAFEAFVRTPAVIATGAREIAPINLADPAPGEAEPENAEPVRIVAYERGEDPYLVDELGREYRDGMYVPGWGTLASLGKHAMAMGPDNEIRRIDVRPVSKEETTRSAAPEVEQADGGEGRTQATPRSRAWAAEQARAAGNRQ